MLFPLLVIVVISSNIRADDGDYKKLLPGVDVCGVDPHHRIIGGTVAELGEHPWLALLHYNTPNGTYFHCGGVLINEKYVLTAAHCIKRAFDSYTLYSIRLGEHRLSTNPDCDEFSPSSSDCADEPVDSRIEDVIVHPNFDPSDKSLHHDIALLRLIEKIAYTDYIVPICLPYEEAMKSMNPVGKKMVVAGWGANETAQQSDVKLKVELPVKTNEECRIKYIEQDTNITNSQLCAGGDKGKDACKGDEGSALMYLRKDEVYYNMYAMGIVSFGPSSCGLEGWPSVYTRVTNYLPWILKNLKS